MGLGHAEFHGLAIHFVGEVLDTSRIVTGEAPGDIVHAVDEHDPKEVDAAVAVAGPDVELDRLRPCVADIDRDRLIEISGFCDDKAGEQLLGAGGGAVFMRVLLVQYLARAGIEDDDSGGLCDRNAIRANGG